MTAKFWPVPGNFELTVPLKITSEVTSHNKTHWRIRSAKIRKWRRRAKQVTAEAIQKSCPEWIPLERAYIWFYISVQDNFVRDTLNMISSMKPVIDGIVDAGLIADDRWQVLELGGCKTHLDATVPASIRVLIEAMG